MLAAAVLRMELQELGHNLIPFHVPAAAAADATHTAVERLALTVVPAVAVAVVLPGVPNQTQAQAFPVKATLVVKAMSETILLIESVAVAAVVQAQWVALPVVQEQL